MTTLSDKKVTLDSSYNWYGGNPQNGHECHRCGGFLVTEFWTDVVKTADEREIAPRRCVQCGDIIDAVILRNRSIRQQSAIEWKARCTSTIP